MAFSKPLLCGNIIHSSFFRKLPRGVKKKKERRDAERKIGKIERVSAAGGGGGGGGERERKRLNRISFLFSFPQRSTFSLTDPDFSVDAVSAIFPPLCWTTQQRSAHCSTNCALFLFPLTHIPHGQLLLFFFVLGSHLEIERLSDTKAVPPR